MRRLVTSHLSRLELHCLHKKGPFWFAGRKGLKLSTYFVNFIQLQISYLIKNHVASLKCEIAPLMIYKQRCFFSAGYENLFSGKKNKNSSIENFTSRARRQMLTCILLKPSRWGNFLYIEYYGFARRIAPFFSADRYMISPLFQQRSI